MREYSIPHLRQSGRISIPEESFDRIREARDLHKEGLGTESVRRMLREGSKQEAGNLSQRLDHLHETLENLHGSVRGRPEHEEVALASPTLRTILARQSLLISAVYNLTEMVEELLLASGKPRKVVFGDVEDDLRDRAPLTELSGGRDLETPVETAAATRSVPEDRQASVYSDATARGERFGSLRQRRRRGVLAVLSVLLVGAVLVWALPLPDGERTSESSNLGERQADGGSRGTESEGDANGVEPQGSGVSEEATETAGGSLPQESGEADHIEVPDVSNQRVADAARTLTRAGLTVDAAKNEASPQEIGTLIGTEPAAGSMVEPGTSVTLILSGGPNWVPPGSRSVASGDGPVSQ